MLALPDYAPIETFLVGRCGKTEREAGLTSFREYRMLREGKDEEWKERMELARWTCFQLYLQNPYIKPPKAQTPRQYIRFPWEEMTAEEANAMKESCHVTEEEQAELDKIFKEVFGEL